jgi:hypothetical protein
MPALARSSYPERHDCWLVHHGDVHVGTIAIRVGNPHETDALDLLSAVKWGRRPAVLTAAHDPAPAARATSGAPKRRPQCRQ